MNRILLLIALSAVLPVSGCRPLMDYSSSSFLTNFSLAELVEKNHSPAGKICAQGALGGGGGMASSRGRSNHIVRRVHQSRARLAPVFLMTLP
jgi:hypothetical protein